MRPDTLLTLGLFVVCSLSRPQIYWPPLKIPTIGPIKVPPINIQVPPIKVPTIGPIWPKNRRWQSGKQIFLVIVIYSGFYDQRIVVLYVC